LQELRRRLPSDEVLLSVRSHKQSQYWWYPEQESTTQVLVVNAYTTNAIWQKTQEILEPFQYISKLKMNFSAGETFSDESNIQIFPRGIDLDDPEEDVENVIHDNVYSPSEVRMYRTELYGHSVLGVTFTQADIDYHVLMRMTNVPKLEDMQVLDSTCRVRTGGQQPTTILLRNRCEKSRPVYIYLRAANLTEPLSSFDQNGAYFAFSTEIRSCRIWNYARPEPSWQNFACMPEMNRSVYFGIHCKCNFISDFDADAMPIIALPMNLKCHLERPVVEPNYQMIIFYICITISGVVYIFFNMKKISDWDRRLYVEQYITSDPCYRGDMVLRFTFGGRYNAGTSANIIFSFKYSNEISQIIVYQDPIYRTFQRNCTISFRICRQLIPLPSAIVIRHDNSGIYPHFFCRSIIISDIVSERTQYFRFQQWVRKSHLDPYHKTDKTFPHSITAEKLSYTWKIRFSNAMEGYMGNWYLFQPIIGPWRFGTDRSAFCRWERSCIFMAKLFISISIVIIFFGRTEPIACDPSPRKYNDIDVVVWLCLVCFLVSCFIQSSMELFLRMIEIYDFL
ncbi:uncharacterized protein Dana_GF27755, partial [Drosophila ananassae]